jgi:hypothetical protein
VAFEQWLENDESNAFGDDYDAALYAPGEAAVEEAAVYFAEAEEANATGDRYELATTILTIVLFFAGISLVVRWRSVRIVLLAAAGAFLLGGAVYLLNLPLAPS